MKATDFTFRGPVDVTNKVKVGDPVRKSEFLWRVPYTVVDKAGNEAATVWRDVIIEEVELFDLENRVRNEVMMEKDREIAMAVTRAVEAEKKKMDRVHVHSRTMNMREATECSTCPACECKAGDFDESKCTVFCEKMIGALGETCPNKERFAGLLDLIDYILSPSVWSAFGVIIIAFVALHGLRYILTVLFNPQALYSSGDIYQDTRAPQQAAMSAAGYSLTPTRTYPDQKIAVSAGPHRVQQHTDVGGGLFSPPQNRMNQYHSSADSPFIEKPNASHHQSQNNNAYDDSIYEDIPIIVPSRTGDLRRR